jgi:hypothetical protein
LTRHPNPDQPTGASGDAAASALTEASPVLDLAAIRERASKATPGPWEIGMLTDTRLPGVMSVQCDGSGPVILEMTGWARIGERDHDEAGETAAFIAHARTDVPALINEVERLRGVVDALIRFDIIENIEGRLYLTDVGQTPLAEQPLETMEGRHLAKDALPCGETHPDTLSEPSAEGWIQWAGGECPVSRKAWVDVRWSDGQAFEENRAGMWRWKWDEGQANLTAYRLSQHPDRSMR